MTDSKRRVVIRAKRPEVVLKQFVPGDADPLFQLIDRNRVHLSQWDDDTAEKYPNLKSVRESITHPPVPSKLRLGIWNGEQLVGTVDLSPLPNTETGEVELGEVGYWLAQKFCRQGFATLATSAIVEYAFRETSVLTVFARVRSENVKSQRVLMRAGFRFQYTESRTQYFFLQKSAVTL